MAKNVRSEDFKLENMIASYPFILAPRKVDKDDGTTKLEYQLSLLWPKPNPLVGKFETGGPAVVSDIMLKIATEHWGDKALEFIKNELIRNPMLDGDGKEGLNKKSGVRNAGYAGHRFIRTATGVKRPPDVFDNMRGADGKLVRITDPDRIYPGCKVHAVVNAYTWENDKGGKGISFGLNMVQFAGDGERIAPSGGGSRNPDGFFEGVPAGAAVPPATTGGAGAGGLFA